MTHTHFFYSQVRNDYVGSWLPPLKLEYIEGEVVVTGKDSVSVGEEVQLGDILISVDGEPIDSLWSRKYKYSFGSNELRKRRNFILYYILYGEQSSYADLVFDHGGTYDSISLQRNYNSSYWAEVLGLRKGEVWEILREDSGCITGYVDMERLVSGDVNNMYGDLKNTDAIIFDVRGYPQGTMYSVGNKILPNIEPFVKFTAMNSNYPGTLYWTSDYFVGPSFNAEPYNGQVFILFNQETHSHGEFTTMSLEVHPNAVKIGSQSSGGDGNVSIVELPGGITTYFTGLGVYYPDGGETQRIGIQPDIYVEPTISSIKNDEDIFIKTAMDQLTCFPKSLPEFSKFDFSVWPNPSDNGVFNVRVSKSENTKLEIVGMLGNVIKIYTNITNQNQIDISDKQKGLYMIRMVDGDDIKVKKLIYQ